MNNMSVGAVPQCIGFIMDGNRRWATEQGLEPSAGHQAGLKTFESVVAWLQEYQVPHGVFYAFSTENWQRSEAEVTFLLGLMEQALGTTRSVRLRIVGDRTRFSPELQASIATAEERHTTSATTTVWIALSYGGRAEIVAAANRAIAFGEPVTEETFSNLLMTAGMPDPDIILRTSGVMRLSNFLPWQSVYSELIFVDTYWPAFTKDDFTRMLAQYGERSRRYGR
jgi:undecaprenyl diphosphate synthase